jgi:GTP cyclohydrolase I
MTKKTKIPLAISPATTHFPTPTREAKVRLTDDEKIEIIAECFQDIMETLGLDVTDDSLSKTPYRVAKMYVKEVFSGLNEENFPAMSLFDNAFHHEPQSNLIFTKVSFTSICEHHFVPMSGFAYIAYLPRKKIIGISKIPRIVRYFACRPQLQERLTAQIADSLALILESDDVAVSLTARHQCVMARGIEDEHSHTITNILRGAFHTDADTKKGFFEAINRRDLD